MKARGPGLLAVVLVMASTPRVAAQCPDGSPPPCAPRAAPAATSVAVLYFESRSPDSSDAYLADGITEAIIQALAGVSRLQVQSRYAVRRFGPGARGDLATVGHELGVTHIVTGTVRRSGDRLRISAELTRVSSGAIVWGQRYDRGREDILDVEEAIAREVAGGIVGRLLPHERAAVATRPTADVAAHQHFLQGNFYLARRQQDMLARAVEEYRAALARDPTFAQPRGRLAYAYALALRWGWRVPGVRDDSVLAAGLAFADEALTRDPDDAEAWLGLGYLRTLADPIRYAGARDALQRAIELDGGNAEAWHQYGSVLLELGDDSVAAAAFRRALDIDPTRMISWVELSQVSTFNRRYDESLRLLDRAIAAAPDMFARYSRARVLLLTGDTGRARSEIDLLRAGGWSGTAKAFAARLVIRSGDPRAVDSVRNIVRAGADGEPPTLRNEDADDLITLLIPVLLDLGERERALRLLEAVQPRGRTLWLWLRWPECDPLRDEPRFQRLAAEAGR